MNLIELARLLHSHIKNINVAASSKQVVMFECFLLHYAAELTLAAALIADASCYELTIHGLFHEYGETPLYVVYSSSFSSQLMISPRQNSALLSSAKNSFKYMKSPMLNVDSRLVLNIMPPPPNLVA